MNPATATPEPVIELLEATLASTRAPASVPLPTLEWTVARGDYWVVGGLPGAGKSALLATAAGLLPPASGTHRLFGRDLAELDEAEQLRARLRLGLVFDFGGRLFAQLTVAENVALPFCYHRNCAPADATEPVGAVLERTGLAALAHQRPADLTRSWQQRVGLARALVLGPELLLLENPLVGLEPRHAQWWLDFLAALAHGPQPLTLIVTTSALRPWLAHGRQFALLDETRWVPLGGRAEVTASALPLAQELLLAPPDAG